MKAKLKILEVLPLDEHWRIVAYLDGGLGAAGVAVGVAVRYWGGIGRVATVRACPEPVEGLDRAFKGEP